MGELRITSKAVVVPVVTQVRAVVESLNVAVLVLVVAAVRVVVVWARGVVVA